MSPEFRRHERYVPGIPLTWEEWRKQARRIFLAAFHRMPGVSDEEHRHSVFHEWAEEEFEVDFENGLSPSDACKRYFEERRAKDDDDQNEPL